MNLIFDMQQGGFGGVTSFVKCRLPRIINIVTVVMLHELYDNYQLHQFCHIVLIPVNNFSNLHFEEMLFSISIVTAAYLNYKGNTPQLKTD